LLSWEDISRSALSCGIEWEGGCRLEGRGFFLPCDWLNIDYWELVVMADEGAFLCVRNGEIDVTTRGLNDE